MNTPTPTTASPIDAVDITGFLDAWNSGDMEKIRALYTQDARFIPEDEIMNLYQGKPLEVLVSSAAFAERVKAYQGMTLRVLGEPIGINDKLVAFLYRWENETSGYDGATLLRYENGKLLLQSLIESDQLTPNPVNDAVYVESINLDEMMNAWAEADFSAAQEIYTDEPIILSDEDLLQATWRDFQSPPKVNQLLSQFSGWNPVVIETPKRIGDLAIFAWHWQAFEYPIGYGVRLIQLVETKINTDLRYAIRPWESSGEPFLEP